MNSPKNNIKSPRNNKNIYQQSDRNNYKTNK